MRVLVIKTSSLGDVIHTLPALSDAISQLNVHFDWVVEESFAEVPQWHSSVNHVLPVALRRWRKSLLTTWRSGEWAGFKARLREQDYDAVIDAQGLLKSAWLTRYVNGPVYGLDRFSAREPIASRFYHHPLAIDKSAHAVERVRQLFANALGYTKPDSKGDYQIDRSRLPACTIKEKYLVFLHGTTRIDKYWPEEYWLMLANRIADTGLRVLLPWGNEEEKQRAQLIAEKASNAEVLPRSNLGRLATILVKAQAVVSVDTGLAHLSAALGTPNITLYGPTSPALVGTYGAAQIHLQASDYCAQNYTPAAPANLQMLTPEIVLEHLLPLLQGDRA